MADKTAGDIFKLIKDESVGIRRHSVLRSAGRRAALLHPGFRVRRERVRGRLGVRRLIGSRLPVDPRVRHDAVADPNTAQIRSVSGPPRR